MSEFVKVRGDDLKDAIDLVRHAADQVGYARPILAGILLERDDVFLRLVAADNYRLATAEIKIDEYSAESWRPAIISIQEIPLIRMLLGGRNGHVKPGIWTTLTRVDDTHLDVETQAGLVRVHLIEGKYPNYRDVLAEKRDAAERRAYTVKAAFLNEVAKIPRAKVGTVKISLAGPKDPIRVELTRMNYTETIMPADTY